MKFQVECGARNRYQDIIAALESNEKYTIKYLGQDQSNPIAMVFETSAEDFDSFLPIVEKSIKSTRYGRIISFRCVPYGDIVYYKK